MNKLKYVILMTSGLLSGCVGMLDDVSSDTAIREDQITAAEIPLLVNGAYAAVAGAHWNRYFQQDVLGDDVVGNIAKYGDYETNNVPSDQTDIAYPMHYRKPYFGIANANTVINFCKGTTDEKLIEYEGEAFFIRAFCYHQLVMKFGAVPLRYGEESPGAVVIRDSEDKVYEQIISDLKNAITKAPKFAGDTYRGNKEAARALLSRIYLTRGMNREAKEMAQEVISSGKFSLQNTNLKDIYKYASVSKENIFRLTELYSNADNGLARFYNPPTSGYPTTGSYAWVERSFYDQIDDRDIRKALMTISSSTDAGQNIPFINKFPFETTVAIPQIRYAEMFLNIAEADAREGVINVEPYNELRLKRGLQTKQESDFSSAAEFLIAIEWERRVEFIGEALRWQDMRRFGTAQKYLQDKKRPTGFVLLPLSKDVMQKEGFTEDNPGY